MTEKRFTIKKSGNGLFYSDGDYSIDNTIQFVIETVESKLNQLNDENNELKSRLCDCHTFLSSKTMVENNNAELRKENEQLKKQSTHFESEMYAYKGSEEYYKQLFEEKCNENEQLKLKIDGLEYALKNIKRIDVEIDLNNEK